MRTGSGVGNREWVRYRCKEGSYWGGTERVGWTYLPGEWDEVMLTKAINANFPDEEHLVVIFRENCIVDNV